MSSALAPAQHDLEADVLPEIVRLYREVLATTSTTPESNFFKMGGDSLSAIGVALAVEKRYGLKVDPVVVYERPVVRDFAEAVVWMLNNPAGM